MRDIVWRGPYTEKKTASEHTGCKGRVWPWKEEEGLKERRL